MAWRNLWRNPTRSLITAVAIALTYALYLISTGVQEWSFDQMRGAAAKAAGGDILLQHDDYLDLASNDLLIANAPAVLERVRKDPRVDHASARVVIHGLLSTSASSAPVSLRGIDVADEARILDMAPYLHSGTYLGDDVEDPLVLGSALAEELQADIGDRVILTATDTRGEMRRALFHLTGTLHTGVRSNDRTLAFTTLAAAQRALELGSRVTQIGVLAKNRRKTAAALESALGADELTAIPWDVAMPELIGFIEMKKGGGAMMGVVLFLVVLFSILNTFLMIVMERVRELGLIAALGLSPRKVAGVVLTESALLAVVAMGIGLALGLAGHFAIESSGIDVAAVYGDSMEVAGVALTDTVIRSKIDVARWLGASASVFVMVLLAGVYPAIKASRMEPTEAMRFYE